MKRNSVSVPLLAVLVTVLLTQSSAKDGFQCPDQLTTGCSCSWAGHDYEIFCETATESIMINISPGNYLSIQCNMDTLPSAYDKLPEVVSGNNSYVKSFSFKACPLPDTPLRTVIRKMGVTKVSILRFQSFNTHLNDTLKRKHLQGLNEVTRLMLESNGLSDLDGDLFDDMTNLTWLSLRTNNIRPTKDLFKSLSKLQILELGHNGISDLPDGVFSHMSSLKRLNLWQNNLNELTPGVFNGLRNLTQLDLSSNNLKTLPSEIFVNLTNLRELNLYANSFTTLPVDLFVNNKKLMSLMLFHNNAPLSELPEYFLANVSRMEEVYLHDISLKVIPENLFENSTAFRKISLKNNMIENIPANLFADQKNLTNLDLSSNKIKTLPNHLFDSAANLEVLILDYNLIEHLQSAILNSLTKLKELSMNNNQIHSIGDGAFSRLSNLKKIDMSHNYLDLLSISQTMGEPQTLSLQNDLDEYGPISPFNYCLQLEYLDLSYNKITNIFPDWQTSLLKLKKLNLSHNYLTVIWYEELTFASDFNPEIDLRFNNITEIIFKHASSIAEMSEYQQPDAIHSNAKSPHVTHVLVEHNPVLCTCVLHEFILYLEDKLDPQVRSQVNVIPGDLTCANPADLRGKFVKQVQPQELVCALDHPESHAPKICPEHCDCFVRLYDKALIVNCSGISDVPALPTNLTVTNQTELHLEGNQITSFAKIHLDTINRNVTRLYLRNNNITQVQIPTNIEVLDIRNNQLRVVDSAALATLNSSRLHKIWLSGNPLTCDCSNFAFLSYLQDKYEKIVDFSSLTCSDGSAVSGLKLRSLCGAPAGVIAAAVLLAAAGILAGVLAALYFRYKQHIKVYLFHRGWLLSWVTEEEVDKDKVYDAFLSFSHKDEEFVINELVAELEKGPRPFKTCIHFRDWVAGEMIPTQIRRSVEDSRRTIVVLSPNFLDSVWGQEEFKEAHSHALKEGRARVIVILYGNIGNLDHLDPQLQAYLSTNTYVKWGDPWFWDKLRYALPHPPYRKPRSVVAALAEKKTFDDKLELIHPSSPLSPIAQTTPPAHQAHSNPLINHVNGLPNGLTNGLTKCPTALTNGSITLNGLKVNGNAKHSDV